jgi:rhamnose transport system substrate-binding protein
MARKRLMLLLALAIAAAVAVGIAASVGTAGSSKKSAGYKVFLLPKFIGIPVFTQNGAGAKAAAKELGDTVTYNGPTEADATKQVPFIDNAVRQGYNAIIISANDPNTVAPALKRAMAKGVKVISYDGDVAPDARNVFVSPPSAKDIGFFQVEWIGSQIGYKGKIAILSATPTAANQNTWIKFMKQALRLPKYKGMQLVKVAYGNDNDTKSAQETQALLQAYPDLKGIISPTTVGVAAAARVLQQSKNCGKVALTGLGLPSQMRAYIKAGCALGRVQVRLCRDVRGARRSRGQADRQGRRVVHCRQDGQAHGRPEQDRDLRQAARLHESDRRQVPLLAVNEGGGPPASTLP